MCKVRRGCCWWLNRGRPRAATATTLRGEGGQTAKVPERFLGGGLLLPTLNQIGEGGGGLTYDYLRKPVKKKRVGISTLSLSQGLRSQ